MADQITPGAGIIPPLGGGGGGGGGITEDFRASMSATQAISAGTQKVNFDTVVFDTGSNYQTASSQYKVPSDGTYIFFTSMRVTGSLAAIGVTSINKGAVGSGHISETYHGTSGETQDGYLSYTIAELTKDDLISVDLSTGASTTVQNSAAQSQFWGGKLA